MSYQYRYDEDKYEVLENYNYSMSENIKSIKCHMNKLIKSGSINDSNYKIIMLILSNMIELEYYQTKQSELLELEDNHIIEKFFKDNNIKL
jgi:urate oxidase